MRSTKTVAVRQGPAATLEVLYRAEYTGMVRMAFTLIGNNAEAEEVVQDSFVEISQRFDELDQPGAYLRTVVVSRCRSTLRRRRRHEHAPTDSATGSHSGGRVAVGRARPASRASTHRSGTPVLLRIQGLGDRQDHRPTCRHRALASATRTGCDAQGAFVMSRFEQDVEVGLRQIADRATPSPDAWNSILTPDRRPGPDSRDGDHHAH